MAFKAFHSLAFVQSAFSPLAMEAITSFTVSPSGLRLTISVMESCGT